MGAGLARRERRCLLSYDLSDYVDVAERVREFKAKYPEGRLRGEGEFVRNAAGEIIGYHYVAFAHTTPDDTLPAVGTAFEPIPGKTTFTRDSEVMNAETSAWGRAIVALGFETKKIASANEVRNRTGGQGEAAVTTAAPPNPPKDGKPQLLPHQKRAYAVYKSAEEKGETTKDATQTYMLQTLGAAKWSELGPDSAKKLVEWLEAPDPDADLPF